MAGDSARSGDGCALRRDRHGERRVRRLVGERPALAVELLDLLLVLRELLLDRDRVADRGGLAHQVDAAPPPARRRLRSRASRSVTAPVTSWPCTSRPRSRPSAGRRSSVASNAAAGTRTVSRAGRRTGRCSRRSRRPAPTASIDLAHGRHAPAAGPTSSSSVAGFTTCARSSGVGQATEPRYRPRLGRTLVRRLVPARGCPGRVRRVPAGRNATVVAASPAAGASGATVGPRSTLAHPAGGRDVLLAPAAATDQCHAGSGQRSARRRRPIAISSLSHPHGLPLPVRRSRAVGRTVPGHPVPGTCYNAAGAPDRRPVLGDLRGPPRRPARRRRPACSC